MKFGSRKPGDKIPPAWEYNKPSQLRTFWAWIHSTAYFINRHGYRERMVRWFGISRTTYSWVPMGWLRF